MENKEKVEFPKGFFSKKRPEVSTKESLKDITPIKWSKDVIDGNKKTIVYSANKRSTKRV